ncbi:putative protease [Melghiribacillus thermohalophilus]|uniref:Putative protease n=1 Tax=Melghiribacillus thermohalophilus TaxID=1324956 RepID=A0A4R3NIF8_9BACI|nr:peptidase U32 family protein [Melghiribacillus thermohalophilus]TCT27072.1 putative protease [Melghiribacillus thermohalophilus]
MKKPELLVTPSSVDDIERLSEAGADAFLVGEEHFGLRLAGEFKREDVKESIKIAHAKNKKVYVAMNALYHNDRVEDLADYIAFLQLVEADAIVFGDPAVLMTVKEVAPNMKLHWNTETTATNWYTCNYWGRKGAKRAVLAREINLDAVLETKEHAEVEIEVQIHGMTSMFQSKRMLIGNYYRYQGKNLKIERHGKEEALYLYDPERDNRYPIFEDVNGTHIMSPNDICMIDELDELLDAEIDSVKIEGILKSPDYNEKVVSLYRKAIDVYTENPDEYFNIKDNLYAEIEAIQPKNRKLDTGFFFKETVY